MRSNKMKHILKCSGSLLLDQFVGIISGFMLVLCVSALFENSLMGYTLAFCICFGFYAYVTYNSAFKSGFRDKHRIAKDTHYFGFWYKGALAGILAAVPLFGLYVAYQITDAGILAFYYMIADMYWTWPMINMFPNHQPLVMALAFLPMIVIPWVGYIAGYKNFMVADLAAKLYKKFAAK